MAPLYTSLTTCRPMAKFLRDLDLVSSTTREEATRWAYSKNFLDTLYFSCLPKVQTNGIGKVIISACRVAPAKKLDNMVDVLQLNKPFDFEGYFAADKETRKRIALDFLQAGLLEVAAIQRWDNAPFHEAYKCVLEGNFVNYLTWHKPVSSPDRKYKAQVCCNYDSDKAELFLVVTHRKKVTSKTSVTTVKPGDVWIRCAIGKLEWLSNTEVQLSPRPGTYDYEAQYKPVVVNAGK